MYKNKRIYDCIVVGAGPGGLQAALHLARYNRSVLLIDKGGGRTTHAGHIVNYLGLMEVSGSELITTGLEQIRNFGVEILVDTVARVEKNDSFIVHTREHSFASRFVLVSAGGVDKQPRVKNLGRFFGKGFYTCIDCDGHLTSNTQLLVMGNSLNAARLSLAMKEMYTDQVTLLLTDYVLQADYRDVIVDEEIPVLSGEPVVLRGEKELEGVELSDGRIVPCETIMASYGWRLNDTFLSELELERDHEGFKILTDISNESSLKGLYVVGAMKAGHSQAIIAAGQGAVAAIDINRKLMEL